MSTNTSPRIKNIPPIKTYTKLPAEISILQQYEVKHKVHPPLTHGHFYSVSVRQIYFIVMVMSFFVPILNTWNGRSTQYRGQYVVKQRINIREDRDQGVGGSHRIRLPFILLLVGINIVPCIKVMINTNNTSHVQTGWLQV